jgi:hypothetical protein
LQAAGAVKEEKMTKKRFLLGVLAIALVFGMTVVGCEDDSTDDNGGGTFVLPYIPADNGGPIDIPADNGGGSFVLTDIPAAYNGKYAMFIVEFDPPLIGAASFDFDTKVVTLVQINNENVSLPMWTLNQSNQIVRYTGNYTTKASFGGFMISDTSTFAYDGVGVSEFIAQIMFQSPFSFANGSATKSANDGTIIGWGP